MSFQIAFDGKRRAQNSKRANLFDLQLDAKKSLKYRYALDTHPRPLQ